TQVDLGRGRIARKDDGRTRMRRGEVDGLHVAEAHRPGSTSGGAWIQHGDAGGIGAAEGEELDAAQGTQAVGIEDAETRVRAAQGEGDASVIHRVDGEVAGTTADHAVRAAVEVHLVRVQGH